MAFSFNPTQAQGGVPSPGVPQVSIQSPGGSVQDAPASIPDSPFLFMRNRDKEMTINAYLQLLLILVATLFVAASVVLFAYSQYLSISINKKKEDIASAEANFKAYPLTEIRALSDKFIALDKILKKYVSSRSPLKYLEKVVENQVVFDDFSFTSETKGKGASGGNSTINFTILTGSQRALVQQLDALNLREYSKAVPSTKMESFADSGSVFKARISAPVLVQGVLADEIVFIPPIGTSTAPTNKSQ